MESLLKIHALLPELWNACLETLIMLSIGLGAALIFGGPLGVFLWWVGKLGLKPNKFYTVVLGGLVNLIRSFPFIILMLLLSPVPKLLINKSIGPIAASIPLSIAAIAYFARLMEQSLKEVPKGVIEAARAMGASWFQIVYKVLLLEARAGIIGSFTLLSISFLSYSAVVGAIGGGGVGDLAIRYGYYRYDSEMMFATVLILILVVQLIQFTGNYFSKKLDKR